MYSMEEQSSADRTVSAAVPAAMQTDNESTVTPPRRSEGRKPGMNTSIKAAHQHRSERPGLGPRRGGQRTVTGLAKHWASPHKELLYVEDKYGKHSWQAKTFRIIHSRRAQHTLMALLLLDVLILFIEVFLAAHYPSCHYIERDGINCCSASAGDDGHGSTRLLLWDRMLASADEPHSHSFCHYPLVDSEGQVGCDSHKYPGVHAAHIVLFSFTIVILSVFLIELLLLIVILRPHRFFRHGLYVLDLFIVLTSMVLELVFGVLHDEDLASIGGLIIIGRVWRFIRIGHGLFASTLEVSLHKIEELEGQVEELRRLMEDSTGAKVNLSSHPAGLEGEL